ncbi:MAG: diadenylate cyclase CdaA, partial [Defluviitaleaceae bacterium]|nr:diadenylate cyclase CdaA [Defluviitaleaceae bacterium]
ILNWELLRFSPFSDILDIALITFVVYKIAMWAKGTKAMSLFRGLAFILIIVVVALIFDLTTVWWLITNLFSAGIIALVVLFQPELRKALQDLGRGKLGLAFNFAFINKEEKEESTEYLEVVINTIFKLSSIKTGALIVLEKQDSLEQIVETGILIEATLTSELLENIFFPNAPMHDGAIIIKEGKIKAASCILPLSQAGVSSDLGTRHRAGLGVSEEYDCIAIISSEESGKVSTCISGELIKGIDEQGLRAKLLGSKRVRGKKRKRGRT